VLGVSKTGALVVPPGDPMAVRLGRGSCVPPRNLRGAGATPGQTPPRTQAGTRLATLRLVAMPDAVPLKAGKHMDDVALLAKSSVLAHLGVRDIGTFLDALDQLALPPSTTVFEQGDDGEHMYFVLDGEGRVRRNALEVARLGRGDHFGELAILGVRPRTTTVQTETPVRLARLSRARFLGLATNHPRVALHVTEALATSLAATVTAMTDDVGLLQQRKLPRRSSVRALIAGSVVDVGMGALVGGLLPHAIDGALVVAATVDQKPVSLETPITSDARIEPLTVASWEGRRIYRASVGLLLLEAGRRALPGAQLVLGPRRGAAQVVLTAEKLLPETLAILEQAMRDLVAGQAPLREELWALEEARVRFTEQGWADAAALLPFHRDRTISLVGCGGTFALGLGPVLPNTSALRGFQLSLDDGQLLLHFGDALRSHVSTQTSTFVAPPMGLARMPTSPVASDPHRMARELAAWLGTMDVTSVGAFNRSCVSGQVGELIRVSEGFHEKHIGRIADEIANGRPIRVVAIAGPSSSGKTTFIKRLKVQLEVNRIHPVVLSLDDYYVDRVRTPRDESGEYDFESSQALDRRLLSTHIGQLLAGEPVRTARYDFKAGTSLPEGGPGLRLSPRSVLLVEGLHALAPDVVDSAVGPEVPFRVFVHPATALPFDRLSSVLPEDLRLLRRIVRDRHQRGYLAHDSIRRWPSVRRGEERHVFTFQDRADVVFDTSLVYELAVLRVYAERYLLEIPPDDTAYATGYRLRQLIDRFVPIHPDHVPPTSLLREFIGGSGFDG
jgi:uridine kinase